MLTWPTLPLCCTRLMPTDSRPTGTRPIVLVGPRGLLGSAFTRYIPLCDRIDLGREVLDPGTPAAIRARIVALKPCLVINCAADTDVEGAESAPEWAFAVNARLARALAEGAAATSAAMVHFSSTGCYGDWKDQPYNEQDPLRPTTAQHRSKAAGEVAVLQAHPQALVLRLGWLFGGVPGQRKNFVWARLVEAHQRAEIGSNPSQYGNPTDADGVARLTLELVAAEIHGILNCVGEGGPASRLDYVAAILAAAGSATRVVPVRFARRAPVSPNESAVNARLTTLGLNTLPPWRDALATYVHALVAQQQQIVSP